MQHYSGSTVSACLLYTSRPVQNALQAMQGRVTGVDITSNNRPGELGDIRIRGNRSLTCLLYTSTRC